MQVRRDKWDVEMGQDHVMKVLLLVLLNLLSGLILVLIADAGVVAWSFVLRRLVWHYSVIVAMSIDIFRVVVCHQAYLLRL